MSELVAKRWAKALLELTMEDEGISKTEVLDDLREIQENINSSNELSNVINNPAVSTEEKQVVICKLFQNKVIPLVYNFLFTLNLKKRLYLLGSIADEYEKELDNLNNILQVEVISAIEFNDEKKSELKYRIAEKLQSDIKVDWQVDPEIIAGLIVNVNETVIDNSVRHKLNKLNESIINGA